MLPVVFRPEAAVDVIEARKWYDNQQAGLGDGFRSALANIVERVQAMPRMYVIVVESVHREGQKVSVPALLSSAGGSDRGTWCSSQQS
jgi:hypothetical protein